MTTVTIPPEGTPAEFTFDVPAPESMNSLGGIRLYFVFGQARPDSSFSVSLDVDGVRRDLTQSGVGPTSVTYVSQFHEVVPAPIRARVIVNQWSHLDPGNTVTLYAWGAQTESGTGVLNPDDGGEHSSMTATIEVGQIEVLDWLDWNRLTGANQGTPVGGS